MKKKIYIIFTVILVCLTSITFGQDQIGSSNVRPVSPPHSLGWDGTGGNGGTLDIKNDFTGPSYNIG